MATTPRHPAPSSTPRAFVAGATGYVGHQLVRELVGRGVRTLAHVRPDSDRLDDWRQRFEAAGAEVSSAAWEARALAAELVAFDPSHVFCCIGTTAARARSSGEKPARAYERVDLGLARLLLQACRGTRARFVYLSALGAGPGRRGAYLETRWKAEQAVRASGLPYTIARPAIIAGPDREESRPLERLGAGLLVPLTALVRAVTLGAAGHALRPISGSELAFGLAQTGLGFSTIGRVVQGQELRRRSASRDEHDAPASRRDRGRH